MNDPTRSRGHPLSEAEDDSEPTKAAADETLGVEEGTIVNGDEDTSEAEPEEPQEGSARVAGRVVEVLGAPDAQHDRQDSLERQDGAGEGEIAQPFHSTRADAPGPKGCWALARHGESCHAAAIRGTDFCAAHSGNGVSANPSLYAPLGHQAHRAKLAVRATMRASPRAVLRARVDRNAERLVGTALNGALSSEVPAEKAARLALELIREADPPVQASVEIEKLTSEDIQKLSLNEAMAIARQIGLEIPGEDLQPPAGSF
jgi:hypothetical protein